MDTIAEMIVNVNATHVEALEMIEDDYSDSIIDEVYYRGSVTYRFDDGSMLKINRNGEYYAMR